MTVHPHEHTRTAATPPARGMGWGIPVIVIAGVMLAGLFAYKAVEDHTGTTAVPISRSDRSSPTPNVSPAAPGATQ